MSAESKWFEEDGGPRYGALTQLEWYEQVRLDLEGHAACEANMDAEIEQLNYEAETLAAEIERLRATKNYNESLAKQEIERLRGLNAANRDRAEGWKEQAEEQRNEVERLRAEWLDPVRTARVFFEKMELQTEVERLRAAEERHRDIGYRAVSANRELQAEVEDLREEKRSMDLLVQRLRAELAGDAEVYRGKIEQLRDEMDEIRGSEAVLFNENERLRYQLAEVNGYNDEMREDLQQLRTQFRTS